MQFHNQHSQHPQPEQFKAGQHGSIPDPGMRSIHASSSYTLSHSSANGNHRLTGARWPHVSTRVQATGLHVPMSLRRCDSTRRPHQTTPWHCVRVPRRRQKALAPQRASLQGQETPRSRALQGDAFAVSGIAGLPSSPRICRQHIIMQASKHIGYHTVGHCLAVLLPGSAVLCRAARIVAEGAVKQQQRQEGEEVEEGQRAPHARRQAPEERGRELWQVVEVSRQTPPACKGCRPELSCVYRVLLQPALGSWQRTVAKECAYQRYQIISAASSSR